MHLNLICYENRDSETHTAYNVTYFLPLMDLQNCEKKTKNKNQLFSPPLMNNVEN